MEVDIVEYSDEYKEQVKGLIFEVYETERGRYVRGREGRPDLNAIRETYQANDGNFWVAVEKGKVIGTIGLMNQGKEWASMHRFCVAKIFRGKGVSTKLFSAFLEFATSHGYKKIVLGTMPDATAAIKFYERNGFKKVDSLPEDIAKGASLSHNELLYKLDVKEGAG